MISTYTDVKYYIGTETKSVNMFGLNTGTLLTFLFLVGEICSIFYYVTIVRKGKVFLRKMPAIDMIQEGVGRAAEMQKPVHLATGEYTFLTRTQVPQTMGALTIMGWVAERCIDAGAELMVSECKSESLRLHESILEDTYRKAGQQYNPLMLHYYSDWYLAYYSGAMHLTIESQAATTMLIGPASSDTLFIGEAGKTVGSLVIMGNATANAFMAMVSDYFFMSDEFYAVVAEIGQEPLQIASLGGQDVMKILAIAIILIGTALLVFGYPIVSIFAL